MEPFTPAESAAYSNNMHRSDAEGFSAAHSVGADIHPISHSPIPPINAKGGRDVPAGWTAVYEGKVTRRWCNWLGSVHGACHAWIADNLCGFTLELLDAGPQFWGMPMRGGVTLALEMAYYDSTEIGREVRVSVRIDRMSGTNAFVTIDIDEIDEGKVVKRLASGRQLQTWRKAKL
ncbi:uncharacterized protein CcaverHIS019_0212080 [Cutaneotrichosporon cavernicola]|uniref:Thioesterase domain-containing protein n=1 Tax=Cutaneotrichosporon cavernicola TaxID=279322 RepID=A0AA48I2D4_9TREE|nr:uncharacterized protein CcaverHIS019_0212080 [Cutaneotrichosporon cavernicola]BEI89846.1 hypothetical protein CcaverHIS019_0212080 [Cutaneotrichosporon cavernicola]BEI97616.1 hypothetical protein CcaverHIS631_0212050 [Cutaneotrichosporon cavernicola]BEJ05395.1 hypothetical protein CcaverHIS641_0212120 [Cutaneotrichosporon cavernicola]